MPGNDTTFLGWGLGILSAAFIGSIKWIRGDVSNRVHKDTFQQYVDGQEKLTEAHVENVKELTASVIRSNERIDKIK